MWHLLCGMIKVFVLRWALHLKHNLLFKNKQGKPGKSYWEATSLHNQVYKQNKINWSPFFVHRIKKKKKQERNYKSLWLITGYHLAPINPQEEEKALQVLNGTKVIAHMSETSTFINSHSLSYSCLQGTVNLGSIVTLFLPRIRISSLVQEPRHRTAFFSLSWS